MFKTITGEFISKALSIHGEKYDYSKTIFLDDSREVTITCPVHGDFLQRPVDHLEKGCLKCQYEINKESRKINIRLLKSVSTRKV